MFNDSRDSLDEISSPPFTRRIVRPNNYLLQIGARLFYKLGQFCFNTNWGKVVTNRGSSLSLQIGTDVVTIWVVQLLQIGASVIVNRGSYYKLKQPLLQYEATITKLITNWGR